MNDELEKLTREQLAVVLTLKGWRPDGWKVDDASQNGHAQYQDQLYVCSEGVVRTSISNFFPALTWHSYSLETMLAFARYEP